MLRIFHILSIALIISGCSNAAMHGNVAMHGIGIYEGSYPNGVSHSYGHHPDGHVSVTVHAKDHPIILVLSSYEPVVWTIQNENTTEINEIILSSYHPSKVVGIESETKVTRKPFGHAYKASRKSAKFEQMVFNYTGLSKFDSLQRSYKGKEFAVH